ncbi:thioredoxin domain-containing protein [Fulvivirga sp. 2943]|uniref:Thioredoxin domain-containing protein n=2 Tax=Fulvivirga sediminis TaxID=2803949 RepID=A0A937F7M2_9BACT|nr:thioredoxin domain-containing protein [Fulvivirga sediminis]MBL3655573.1 thioredoxin domain-containing protein [Fulvivirga sediminis]
MPEGANHLIHSTSPYLLQHAYNPVQWYPWGEEALAKAKKEDKPILVSIGYSACHWCHVMEKESFENDSIADLMNKHFVCIKVDREERPDIDQIYMDALQAMGQNGGWPLNVFLTADQKPFYGGTYFPPQGWAQALSQIAKVYETKRNEVEASANELTEAIATSETIKYQLASDHSDITVASLDSMFRKLSTRFDREKGGFNQPPKFPMPSNWLFLLRYYHLTKDPLALSQIELTLNEIANGGIYDQVGGGFARYSVDANWLIPHFEKMLYDNGQLLSLYSEAYTLTQKRLYKNVVYHTIAWLEREMTNEEGGFYSALDADSEGEEGKFYVWTNEELEVLLNDNAPLIKAYYNASEQGNWEEGKNILHKKLDDSIFAENHKITTEELQRIVNEANEVLLKEREKRERPGLDDKILSGWNALTVKGLVDAYNAFGEERFLNIAIKNADFITEKMMDGDKLYRNYKNGKASIDGYLEDYAFAIDAFAALYQATFDERWLKKAKELTDYTLEHFFDKEENLFFYTDNSSQKLIARKKEIFDNVIPSSNSQMAINLYVLGTIYDKNEYKNISTAMLSKVKSLLSTDIGYLSNWGCLYTYMATPTAEIAIVGENALAKRSEFVQRYIPNKVMMGASSDSNLPLMEGKTTAAGKTTIYVCYNKTCKLPVHEVKKAFDQLQKP